MRSVFFNRDDDPKVELANFEAKVKATFQEVMPPEQNSELFVQLKDEKWQGEFVDLTPSGYIPDKSVVRVVSYAIKFYDIVHMHVYSYIALCILIILCLYRNPSNFK